MILLLITIYLTLFAGLSLRSVECIDKTVLRFDQQITAVTGCVKSCSGVPDGDYQSCISCYVYASCYEGRLYDNRPCPFAKQRLEWDDKKKQCIEHSSTCKPGDVERSPCLPNPCRNGGKCVTQGSNFKCQCTPGYYGTKCEKGRGCIKSCNGVNDGDYQSCTSCYVYATCAGGRFFDKRPCPKSKPPFPRLTFDDQVHQCVSNSSTCTPAQADDLIGRRHLYESGEKNKNARDMGSPRFRQRL